MERETVVATHTGFSPAEAVSLGAGTWFASEAARSVLVKGKNAAGSLKSLSFLAGVVAVTGLATQSAYETTSKEQLQRTTNAAISTETARDLPVLSQTIDVTAP